MKAVLVMLALHGGQGISIDHIEFPNSSSCMQAKAVIEKELTKEFTGIGRDHYKVICSCVSVEEK